MSMDDCLFCKIIAGKIPVKKVYEDDKVFGAVLWKMAVAYGVGEIKAKRSAA